MCIHTLHVSLLLSCGPPLGRLSRPWGWGGLVLPWRPLACGPLLGLLSAWGLPGSPLGPVLAWLLGFVVMPVLILSRIARELGPIAVGNVAQA